MPTVPVPSSGRKKADGSCSCQTVEPMVAALDALCLRALERAGSRLLTRSLRGRYPEVASHLLHTRIAVSREDVDRLLVGAFDTLGMLLLSHGAAGWTEPMAGAVLRRYLTDLLTTGTAHDVESLRWVLHAVPRG